MSGAVSIEQIVRPFQGDPSVAPAKRTITAEIPVDAVVVSIGREGGRVLNYAFSTFTEVRPDQYTEVTRTTKDKRVENPSDANQFVVVKQIEQLQLRNDVSGAGFTMNLKND